MKRITDPSFRYVSSLETDLSKTFARIRRERKAADEAQAAERAQQRDRAHATPAAAPANVCDLKRAAK